MERIGELEMMAAKIAISDSWVSATVNVVASAMIDDYAFADTRNASSHPEEVIVWTFENTIGLVAVIVALMPEVVVVVVVVVAVVVVVVVVVAVAVFGRVHLQKLVL